MQDLSIVGLPESPVSSWIAGIDPTGSAANVENLWYQITKNVWFIVNIVEILCIRKSVRALDGDRLLLTKYANRPGSVNYALVAGFTEIGETLEETVQREVMEEVGLKVKNIRYYKSQPWSFSSTLLCGFFCDVDGDTSITLDTNELALAEWFARENIPVEDDGISLTREMIRVFKHGE